MTREPDNERTFFGVRKWIAAKNAGKRGDRTTQVSLLRHMYAEGNPADRRTAHQDLADLGIDPEGGQR